MGKSVLATTTSSLGKPPLSMYHGYVMARPRFIPEEPVDPNDPNPPSPTNEQIENQMIVDAQGRPLAPISRAKIYPGLGLYGHTYSDDDGRYALGFYSPPCSGTSYSENEIITAEFYPDIRPRYPVLIAANTYIPVKVYCVGLGVFAHNIPSLAALINHIQIDEILSPLVQPRIYRLNIFMDTMIIIGFIGNVTNGVDENNDGENDPIPITNNTEYDEYGLLTSISEEDLQETDVYVYNERTKEIIAEVELNPVSVNNPNPENPHSFRTSILGPNYNAVYRALLESGQLWIGPGILPDQSTGILKEATRARPGDPIHVIAINRATGYMGSKKEELYSIGFVEEENEDITIIILDLEPPNIKVTAEREYDANRRLQGTGNNNNNNQNNLPNPIKDRRNYLIGFEGSALASDDYVRVTTNWKAHDGTPLPDDLPGYTGRMARIAINNQSGSPKLSEIKKFEVRPGITQQWITTPRTSVVKDHYYMHLCGESVGSGKPCVFEDVRTAEPFIHRPKKSVPMQIVTHGSRVNDNTNSISYDHDEDGIPSIYENLLGTKPNDASSVPKDEDKDGIPDDMWKSRGELHFSIYDLNIQSMLLTPEDAENPGDRVDIYQFNETPMISWEDQQVDIAYRLRTPNVGNTPITSLPRASDPREFAFSFIGETITVELDQNRNAIFDDLSAIRNASVEPVSDISPEEFLVFQLFQQSDTGNVLWEFDIDRALHVYYQIPSDETEIFIERTQNRNGINLVRTISGVRLKYKYNLPYKTKLESITWNFNTPGRYCEYYGVNDTNCTPIISSDFKYGASGDQAKEFLEIYWEPTDATGENTIWSNNFNTTASVEVNYKRDETVITENLLFRVESRTLFPIYPPAEPMEGSDVEILETILWQLGLSSQFGYPGGGGTRINSIADEGSTVLARPLDVYSTGFAYVRLDTTPPPPRSVRAPASLEKMVRRFQGRFIPIGTGQSNARISSGEHAISDGIVDIDVLGQLRVMYYHYWNAIESNIVLDRPVIYIDVNNQLRNGDEQWVTQTLNELSNSYTDATHTTTLDTGENVTRRQLLLAWLRNEGGSHWGRGDPQSDYRITEGGGDEFASMGFNQILFQYSYGANPLCRMNELNMFDPSQNMQGFARWLSVPSPVDCDNNLTLLFIDNLYSQTYNNAIIGNTLPRLRGFFRSLNNYTSVASDGSHTDDAYEKLSKAIMGYNAGKDNLDDGAWVRLLLTLEPSTDNKKRNIGNTPYHGYNYAIDVKQDAGMRLRTYTLEWTVTEAEGTTYDNFEIDDTFCFNYSELDWFNSGDPFRWWTTVKDEVLVGGPSVAVNCNTGQ